VKTVVLALGMLSATCVLANDLSGVVKDADGNPIAGATVFIHTAGPRIGTAIYCPSCYADCQKQTSTDDAGQFTIESLDPSLVFRILVAAEGYRSRIEGSFDPAEDNAIVSLDPLPTDLAPEHMLRGTVVDAEGNPVVGAEVSPDSRHSGSSTQWGGLNEIDSISVTNQNGEFLLMSTEPGEAYTLEVKSASHATKKFYRLGFDEPHELVVGSGATVRGRLLKGDRPVAGVVVGLVQCDRGSDSFTGQHEIGTNEEGQFEFAYIPPSDDYYVYTQMETMAAIGALPLRRVTTEGDESVVELGDMPIGPAHALSGRLILTDGQPVHGPVQVLLSREGAWDSQKLMVEADGLFEFYAVPHDEPVSIYTRIPGYRLAAGKNRFQQLRSSGIGVFVENSRDNIEIYFEPED
jgi:protocatechuate 3,4-dioxygenase beta subunit